MSTPTDDQGVALAHARHLAEHGVPVFLAAPDWGSDLGYRLPAGWQATEPDPAVLDAWEPDMAVCAVTGHLVDVLDVDPRNGGEAGAAGLANAGLWPKVYGRQATPSGGTHDLIATLGVRKGVAAPGVDLQAGDTTGGGRGFVFLAPTERASRVTGELLPYRWVTPPDVSVLALVGGDDTGAALAAKLARGPGAGRRPAPSTDAPPTPDQRTAAAGILAAHAQRMATAADGTRNNTLIRLLPTLYRFVLGDCLDEAEVDARMREAADLAGIGDEYDGRSESAWRYAERDGPDRPSGPEADFEVLPTLDPVFDATPTLTHIRQAAHSRLISAPALLCYVLARVLAEVRPRTALPPVVGSRASLNLGVAVVGESGAGKSALLAVSRELLGEVGSWQDEIERNVGSGEGMVQQYLYWDRSLKENVMVGDPRRVFLVDEIDQLGATQNRSGATIGPTLRSALTGGPLGQANATADRSRHVPAGTYRALLLVGVQPTRSEALLRDTDAGTPQRLVWTSADDPTIPDEDVPYPGALSWRLPPLSPTLDYPEAVKAEVKAARRARARGHGDPVEGHKLLTRLKVAAGLALLHGDAAISDRWWELAGGVIDTSLRIQEQCRRVLADELATSRLHAGRLDGIRAEGAAGYRNERVVLAAKAIARKVAKHAEGAKDGNDQKHEPGDGCTGRCVSRALRDLADRDELRESAVDHAAEHDWTAEQGGRWFLGESRPVLREVVHRPAE